mgnify:FL=1|tara:strand:+ start:3938 stop:4300 length:363 start_codon:yes stop_codon:yes gene_type:complete
MDSSTLSLAELKKILTDNGIKDTSTSKEELVELVVNVVETNSLIEQMMNEEVEPDPITDPIPDPRTLERERQDLEYQRSLQQDIKNSYAVTKDGGYIIQQPDFEELSPRSLRAKRIAHFM